MADGTTKPISDIEPGDRVQAADPETGEQSSETVTAVWVHDDTLVELQVLHPAGDKLGLSYKSDGTAIATITTTADHPFWNHTEQQWQPANTLDPGDQLTTTNGTTVTVTGLLSHTQRAAAAYNLTTTGPHTYYVLAGNTPVLVHNVGGCGKPINLPGWRKVDIDIDHIVDRHTAGGKTYQQSSVKDKFPDYMSPRTIESAVRQAYRKAYRAGPSQGPRVLLRGNANGMNIEMWLNKQTGAIETAYPVGRSQ